WVTSRPASGSPARPRASSANSAWDWRASAASSWTSPAQPHSGKDIRSVRPTTRRGRRSTSRKRSRSPSSGAGPGELRRGPRLRRRLRRGSMGSTSHRGRKRHVELLDRIDALISERHLLKHPFYADWRAGTLPREALQDYAAQYYAFESSFPRFLSA